MEREYATFIHSLGSVIHLKFTKGSHLKLTDKKNHPSFKIK